MKVSENIDQLKQIAVKHGLKLNKLNDFQLAIAIFKKEFIPFAK